MWTFYVNIFIKSSRWFQSGKSIFVAMVRQGNNDNKNNDKDDNKKL